ncbi:MAG TPA: hypothetical protein VFB28_11400 [Terriglobales bacterium]|nr:hypothetical protein [Terriglobales bacterium]
MREASTAARRFRSSAMPTERPLYLLWKLVQSPGIIFLIALTTRIWIAAQVAPNKAWEHFYRYNEFAHIASSVVSGCGYCSPWANTPLAPTAVEPPVFSYLLALIFKFAGVYSYKSLCIAILLNALFSAITAVLLFRVAKRDFGAPVAVLATWVWSCWLYEAAMGIRLWESSLAALLLTAAIFVVPYVSRSRTLLPWLLFGILAAIAGLTNTTLLAVFPLLWFWLWWGARSSQGTGKRLAVSITTFIVLMIPWTIRNYEVFGRVMPVRDNFGLELWLGNHEGVTRRFDSDFPILNPSEYNRLGELRFMEEKRKIAIEFIREHPGQFLGLSANRAFLYWTAPDVAIWLPITVLAWMGLMVALRQKGSDGLPYAIVMIAFPMIYYVTHTFNSYRHPTEPVMFMLAGYVLVESAKLLLGKSRTRRVASSTVSSDRSL